MKSIACSDSPALDTEVVDENVECAGEKTACWGVEGEEEDGVLGVDGVGEFVIKVAAEFVAVEAGGVDSNFGVEQPVKDPSTFSGFSIHLLVLRNRREGEGERTHDEIKHSHFHPTMQAPGHGFFGGFGGLGMIVL